MRSRCATSSFVFRAREPVAPIELDEDVRGGDADVLQELDEAVDHLGVAAGGPRRRSTRADLVELPVTPALPGASAEHRPAVVPAGDRLHVGDVVLDEGAHAPPCPSGRRVAARRDA